MYAGIAWRTAFNIISLTASNRYFVFQLDIFPQVLSMKYWKELVFFLPIIAGTPKYLSKEPVALTPAILMMVT